MALVLVRGAGDIGSAVAHRAFQLGHRVALHDAPRPAHTRRGMAFTDVFFDGRCELDAVVAKRARDLEGLARMLECGRAIPCSDADFHSVVNSLRPAILVDARMRKHMVPETLRGLASLTIGLGPNFEAGANADIVVETAWGNELGRVISKGRAKDLSGEPREIMGHARDRYIYAPEDGAFETTYGIGNSVSAGESVARIGEIAIHAPLAGVVRGIVHDRVLVGVGKKVLEIDPRGRPDAVFGIGERPAGIAVGVLKAIAQFDAARVAG